jgi:hypothetical protein
VCVDIIFSGDDIMKMKCVDNDEYMPWGYYFGYMVNDLGIDLKGVNFRSNGRVYAGTQKPLREFIEELFYGVEDIDNWKSFIVRISQIFMKNGFKKKQILKYIVKYIKTDEVIVEFEKKHLIFCNQNDYNFL